MTARWRLDGRALELDRTRNAAVLAHGADKNRSRVALGRHGAAHDRELGWAHAVLRDHENADVPPQLLVAIYISGSVVHGDIPAILSLALKIARDGLHDGFADEHVPACAALLLVVLRRDACGVRTLGKRLDHGAVPDDDVVLVCEEAKRLIAGISGCDPDGGVVERHTLVDVEPPPRARCDQRAVGNGERTVYLHSRTLIGACLQAAAARHGEIAVNGCSPVLRGARAQATTARHGEIAVNEHGIVILGACRHVAATRDSETAVNIQAVAAAALGNDVAARAYRCVAANLNAIGGARGVHRATTADGEVALGVYAVGARGRGIDGAITRDVDVALGLDGIRRCIHGKRVRGAAGYVELGVLVDTVYHGDALSVAVRDGVVALVGEVQVTGGLDGAAIVAFELHVVGAVPAPGLVARCGIVVGATDIDPLRGHRGGRERERGRRDGAQATHDEATGGALPIRPEHDARAIGTGAPPLHALDNVRSGLGRHGALLSRDFPCHKPMGETQERQDT